MGIETIHEGNRNDTKNWFILSCRLSVNEPLQGSQNISAKLAVNTKIIV